MKQLILAAFLLTACLAPGAQVATGKNGVVASGHPLATAAGLRVLKSGGNAVDAAVAVGLTLGVVDGHNSGIGGGCFMLIRTAGGEILAIDGRERAPRAATRDMFLRGGKAEPDLSRTGPLAVGVPGELAAFDYAVQRYGRMRLADLLVSAAHLAAEGFAVTTVWSNRVSSVAKELDNFPESKRLFLKGGHPPAAGTLFRQPELAQTYRCVATQGIAWFYNGPFAQAVEHYMKRNGGLIAARDFSDYQVRVRTPVRGTYRGYEIVSFPPPSSGGVHLVQMLNILEQFPLGTMEEGVRYHVLAETMKLAFADRAHWLGDPDFTKVPGGLTAKTYARELARNIDLSRARPVKSHGLPPGVEGPRSQHTTHFSVVDGLGNWVACTATINTTLGSKVVIPGTGVVLNNQMDDFAAQPGVTNYFGLPGSSANEVAPGKTPLSSMTPTLLMRDGKPILSLGAAGGPKIITAVLLQVIGVVDLSWTPEAAMNAPRFHHQWIPDILEVEKTSPPEVRERLRGLGHQLRESDALSTAQSAGFSAGAFIGVADPRYEGSAAAW